MSIIINPGSNITKGTFKQAKINAKQWLKLINLEFPEVGMLETKENYDGEGRWRFEYQHKVTKAIATLDIHGFTDEEVKSFMFGARVYWQGSSVGDPSPEDWLTDEYDWFYAYKLKKGD